MKKTLALFSLLYFLLSCSDSKKSQDYPILKVSLEKGSVSMMDLFEKCEVVPLETNDSCLLIWPNKILYTDGCYEIFDAKHPALFLFKEDGQFVRRIGKRGDGPTEYREVYDVIHDENSGNICMLSPYGEVFVYTSDGTFIEKIVLPQKSNYQAFEDFNDCFVTWTLPVEESEKGISFISKNTKLNIKEYWNGNRNLYFLYPRAFHKYESNLYFSRPFNREVYNICKDSINIAYRWDFGKDNYHIEDLGFSGTVSKGGEESDLLLKYLKDSTIPYVISNQNQTSKFYYFQLVFGFTPQGRHHLFYSKDDGKSFFFKETIEGIKLNPLFFSDKFMICLAFSTDLDSYKKVLNVAESNKLINRKEEDNPVLIKCYYK